ncbi:E3 binding domain-containing protein, partial [Streptomyces torulosus]|uniref:E3 binding domain-containing protein n=1 Tax=Streptomyces torulosus TaxID=68276 RepID=UPI003B8335D3
MQRLDHVVADDLADARHLDGLAAENGVDLASVKGTGVGGRIRKQDVIAAAEAAKAAAAAPAPTAAAPAAAASKKAPVLEASPLRGQTIK